VLNPSPFSIEKSLYDVFRISALAVVAVFKIHSGNDFLCFSSTFSQVISRVLAKGNTWNKIVAESDPPACFSRQTAGHIPVP
jgi:hypothetical protein